MTLIFNLLSGAVGGNLLGMLSKGKTAFSTIFGLIGGGAGHLFGGKILELVGAYSDFGALGTYGLSGGLGAAGALLGRIFLGGKKKS